jgi:hypothetical protein
MNKLFSFLFRILLQSTKCSKDVQFSQELKDCYLHLVRLKNIINNCHHYLIKENILTLSITKNSEILFCVYHQLRLFIWLS